jgi:hypothetical protein
MGRRISRLLAVALAVAVVCSVQTPYFAATIPSKVETESEIASRVADLGTVQDVLAREDVAEALSAHGLTSEEVENRIARLSNQDLRYLASNLSQIQAAGEEVPEYIWWLAGGLLAVLILVAIL